jgi:hypothetical protein
LLNSKVSLTDASISEQEFTLGVKLNEIKATRTLSTEITAMGATVHDLLGSEIELRVSGSSLNIPLYFNQIPISLTKLSILGS